MLLNCVAPLALPGGAWGSGCGGFWVGFWRAKAVGSPVSTAHKLAHDLVSERWS